MPSAPPIVPTVDQIARADQVLAQLRDIAARWTIPAAAATLPGAAPVLATLAAISLWFLPGREDLERRLKLSAERALEILTAVELLVETVPPGRLAQAMVNVQHTLREVRRVLGEVRQELPRAQVIGPSPERLQSAAMADLRAAAAATEFWRRQHTTQVHQPIRRQWERYAEAAVAHAVAVRTTTAALGQAVHTIVDARLPDLGRRLRRTVATEAEARRAGDTVLGKALSRASRTLRATIAEVRAWVATEVVPELQRAVETEGALRLQADRTLQRGLATETRERTATDLELATALAPVLQWAGSFGVHTTTKVHRIEPTMDRLLSTRGDWARHLLLPPAFAAVVLQLLRQVAPALPGALGGLERAALAYLGQR